MSKVLLHVLGTAQDAGLPQPNCFCANCLQAMDDPAYARQAAALAIVLPEEKSWHLIDATPDIKTQMIALQRQFGLEGRRMESIFLTHAHLGHYPGLLFLGREAMNTRHIPIFTGERMKQFLETEAPWRQLIELGNIEVNALSDGHAQQLNDRVKVTPVDVPHRNEFSETFGFWIEGPHKKALYIPDIDKWEDWHIDIADACHEADMCLLDGTFFSKHDLAGIGRDFREIPHPLMSDTMTRLAALTDVCDIYFTHLNHGNPVIPKNSDARRELEARGFHIAEDRMTFEL
ncbi:MBL fold metallo-hydrolase [Lentibacillus saliphilus]|uniref:MBL fold metallo-hydrolase n=1 Tax=Lentibacillus saliphilus TaxID=2737028 RepID=UPI001C2F2B30|nr:MBL fold metallo-hydrolase [Lentibacillus saliphilus]